MRELSLNEVESVNGGIVILVLPTAYKAFVAGATFGAGLVFAAYKLL